MCRSAARAQQLRTHRYSPATLAKKRARREDAPAMSVSGDCGSTDESRGARAREGCRDRELSKRKEQGLTCIVAAAVLVAVGCSSQGTRGERARPRASRARYFAGSFDSQQPISAHTRSLIRAARASRLDRQIVPRIGPEYGTHSSLYPDHFPAHRPHSASTPLNTTLTTSGRPSQRSGGLLEDGHDGQQAGELAARLRWWRRG